MLSIEMIIAGAAVVALALRPRDDLSALVCAAGAVVMVGLRGLEPARVALEATGPMLVFLTAALSLAWLVQASGLVTVAADALARGARGGAFRLYVAVCVLTVALTACVSLDGAVVLVAPIVVELSRRYRAPLIPLLLGAIAAANASSSALPQGNPTNLVLMARLGISPRAFASHLVLPSLAAALAATAAVAITQRGPLGLRIAVPERARPQVQTPALRALAALSMAALGGWTAPLAGLAPVWPFAVVAVCALAVEGRWAAVIVPWRIAVQVAALLTIVVALIGAAGAGRVWTVPSVGAVALLVSAFAALANNLPASVAVASLPLVPPGLYGAVAGLSVGALATPHGSVATLIALDLADPSENTDVRAPLAIACAAGLAAAVSVLVLLP